jgi:[ribosomal protein S18]-alanine N-acetyltransferase
VRQANVADVPAIMEVGRDSVTTSHWSRRLYEGQLAITSRQKHAERVSWVVEDENAALPKKTPGKAPEILAFLLAHRVLQDWELENIVVKGTARRRGIGTCLLGEFIAYARAQQGARILLEVRESNHSARALYRKFDFEETGLRKGYYANPPEDAIVCQLRLS